MGNAEATFLMYCGCEITLRVTLQFENTSLTPTKEKKKQLFISPVSQKVQHHKYILTSRQKL